MGKKAVSNVTGPENVELYWFMLELFTDHDTTKCGRVNISQFTPMMSSWLRLPRSMDSPHQLRDSTRLSSRSTTPGVTATSPLMSGSSSLPRRSSRPLSNILPSHDIFILH